MEEPSNKIVQAIEIGHEFGRELVVPTSRSAVKEIKSDELMLDLSKYILLLATLVATVTYAAAFSPAGGEWQDKDAVASHLVAGYSIIRATRNLRYRVFYYCNATAFASSLVVIVLVLFQEARSRGNRVANVKPMQAVMVLDLLSAVGACAAGTCYDRVTTIYSLVLVGIAITWLVVQMAWASFWSGHFNYSDAAVEKRLRKVLMLFGTFAVGVTYVARMSTPGGFWDDSLVEGEGLGKHQTVFLCFNSTAFVTSLLIIVVLLDRKPRVNEAYGLITVALLSLTVAYIAGSCRKIDTTIYVSSLVGAVLIFIIILQIAVGQGWTGEALRRLYLWSKIEKFHCWWWTKLGEAIKKFLRQRPPNNFSRNRAKTRSLVLLLATLAATVTYQAGLNPPGGVWPDNGSDGHFAGDPILLTTNDRRFKVFFYCNSIAFLASLVTIILVQNKLLLGTRHVLQATMIVDLFALIGAYAAGSCRDIRTSVYTMALSGAVLLYVAIHVVFSSLNYTITSDEMEIGLARRSPKWRKRLLLFAVLEATITYQAGLTPPGGFLLQDHYAGDPVLLYNFPHRYTAFFYCNSVSFMVSIVLIILLANRYLYRLARRSYAPTICTAAGMLSLMGSYAAGSTQHLRTSIYIFVLVAVVLSVIAGLVLYMYVRVRIEPKLENGHTLGKKRHAKRKYLMLIGILVASITYQAGLNPPAGGTWQSDSGWYLAFFYSNFTSFVASILVIVLLLPQWWSKKEWSLKTMKMLIFLDLLALQGAYAAGSSKGWKTSMYVLALIGAVLAYIVIHIALAVSCRRVSRQQSHDQTDERIQEWNQEQLVAA